MKSIQSKKGPGGKPSGNYRKPSGGGRDNSPSRK